MILISQKDRPSMPSSNPPPALRARSTSAGLVPAELSAKNHPCDAKDHARPRKYLEQNSFLKRGVQVQPNVETIALSALIEPVRYGSWGGKGGECCNARRPETGR